MSTSEWGKFSGITKKRAFLDSNEAHILFGSHHSFITEMQVI